MPRRIESHSQDSFHLENVTVLDNDIDKKHKVKETLYTAEEIKGAKLVIKQMIIYFLFLIVIIIKEDDLRDNNVFHFNEALDKLLFKSTFTTSHTTYRSVESLATTDYFYKFLQDKFLPRLLDKSSKPDNNESHYVLDENIFLGKPLIRQLRVEANTCDNLPELKEYFSNCYDEYNPISEQKEGLFNNLEYTKRSSLNANAFVGQLATYEGGGYVYELSYDLEETREILKNLMASNWIDAGTRLILIEISLYNDNAKMYNNVKVAAEFPATGGILFKYYITSSSLYSSWNRPSNYLVWIANVLFIGLHIFYTIQLINKATAFGSFNFLLDIRNLFRCVVNLGLWCFCAYEFWHIWYVSLLQKRFKADPEKLLRLDTLTYWNKIFSKIFYVLGFVNQLNFLKFLEMNRTLLQFNGALARIGKDLTAFALFVMIMFMDYSLLGYFLFAHSSRSFIDFSHSALTLMRIIIGEYDYTSDQKIKPIWGPIYFTSFDVLMFLFLLNMLIVTVQESYIFVKNKMIHFARGPTELLESIFLKSIQTAWDYLRKFGKSKQETEVLRGESNETESNEKLDEKEFEKNTQYLDEEIRTTLITQKDQIVKLHNSVEELETILELLYEKIDAIANQKNLIRSIRESKKQWSWYT